VHCEPHATLGWAIGNLGGADRRLRNYCVLGAVLPDVDAATYLFGPQAYGDWHHTFGHNVFLWAAFVAWVGWRCKSRRAFVLSGLSFGSHLLTDAQLSGWALYLFWPFSHKGYIFPTAVGLDAPINYWLVYVTPLVIVCLALLFKRTPIDVILPRLDRMLIASFQRKTLSCAVCAKGCNHVCDVCSQPICISHATVKKGLRLICPSCLDHQNE